MWIGMDVTGRFHDQFEVIFELEQMIEDAVMTNYKVLCGFERMLQEDFTTNVK
jgi:hypothetical protein